LLISVLLFAGFTVLAFTGLFDLVETRFYNPAVVRAIDREIDADTQVIEGFLLELQGRFAATLDDGAVRRSFLSGLESGDIALRAGLYGKLLESLGGLQSVRFIDAEGTRIQFSTWQPDILRRDQNSIAYRNYNAAGNSAAYIPFGQVEATVGLGPRMILDEVGERIVFSFPFYDSFDVYQGTALFSLSIRAVMDRMAAAGRIKIGEDISVISEPPGIIIGLPFAGRNTLLPLVARVWNENNLSLGALNSSLTSAGLALVSRRTAQNIYIGRLVNESLLNFPPAMRIILLVSFLTTAFLIIFLIFNIRQDDIAVIQSRLKKLQINLLEEYYEHKGDLDWNRLKRELEQRREDFHSELKRGLNPRSGDFIKIDSFIDKSWDDLTAIIGNRVEKRAGIDRDKPRALLSGSPTETSAASLPPIAAEEAPELEAEEPADLEVLDEPEELEPAELAEAEPAGFVVVDEPAEPEPVEPEAETPAGEPAVLEAVEPEPVEPEPVEPEPVEPEFGEPVDMAEFYGFDSLEPESPGGPAETTLNDLASALEFSPDPEEMEREKEEAARAMAEHFEIQSPFAAILSTLTETEFEADPVESLESLEKDGQAPDNSPEAVAEELELSFAGPQLFAPFATTLNSEITPLEAEDEETAASDDEGAEVEYPEADQAAGEGDADAIFAERDGVLYIDESVRRPDKETLKGLNTSLKNLIDSILDNS
jgi:hypothetical protein